MASRFRCSGKVFIGPSLATTPSSVSTIPIFQLLYHNIKTDLKKIAFSNVSVTEVVWDLVQFQLLTSVVTVARPFVPYEYFVPILSLKTFFCGIHFWLSSFTTSESIRGLFHRNVS